MRNRLREYSQTLFRSGGGIVFVGDVFSKLLTFTITIILFELVTPVEYRIYGFFLTALATINQFTDSGLHQSFIRFYSLYYLTNTRRAEQHLLFALKSKCAILVFTAVLVFLGADSIANRIFFTSELGSPIKLLSAGILGSGIYEFFQAYFQARQEFRQLTFLRVFEGAGKLFFILISILIASFTLNVVFLAYIIIPPVVGTLAVFMFWRQQRTLNIRAELRGIGKEIFHFGKWMMLTSFLTMLLRNLDIFMITGMLANDPYNVGLYNAAVRLCTPLVVITGSVSTVFFPKAMAIKSKTEMKLYIAESLRITVPVTMLSLIYLVCVSVGVPLLFPNYQDVIPLFLLLFIGYAWTIIGNPLTMLVLSINKAEVVSFISFIQLILTVLSHYVFILWFGVIGAAISTALLWFLSGGYSLYYLSKNMDEIDHLLVDK